MLLELFNGCGGQEVEEDGTITCSALLPPPTQLFIRQSINRPIPHLLLPTWDVIPASPRFSAVISVAALFYY